MKQSKKNHKPFSKDFHTVCLTNALEFSVAEAVASIILAKVEIKSLSCLPSDSKKKVPALFDLPLSATSVAFSV